MKTSYNKEPEIMDKENKHIDPSLEKAVNWMEHSEEFTPDEIEQLSRDEDFKRAYKDLLDCKTAAQKEYARNTPNVNQAWEQFKNRHQHKHSPRRMYWIGTGIGIAATILFVCIYTWIGNLNDRTSDIQVFAANQQTQGVMLQTASGEVLALNSGTQETSLNQLGVSLTQNADTLGLIYASSNTQKKVDTHILTTPRGQDFKITLSDGTIVWLNAESQLKYPSKFIQGERRVQLQGEAYFQVAHNAKQPFIVETSSIQTKVLGTEFNVNSYEKQNTHITLIKGSVEVKSNKQNAKAVRITPGEDAHLQADGTFLLKQVDIDSYVYWKEGYFYFDNITLVDIMQSIGRWYNTNIVFRNKQAMKYKMHYLCNRKEGIEHVVELFNMMGKVNVKYQDNTLYIE